jgi:hypothetical protein
MRSGWKLWRKKNRSNPSHTPGSSKGEMCQTDPIKKFFASNPKAYKHKDYDVWDAKFRSYNGQKVKV